MTEVVQAWLESFSRLPLDDAFARETVLLRRQHGLKVPDAIILATARCAQRILATRNSRNLPFDAGGSAAPLPAENFHSLCLQCVFLRRPYLAALG